MKYSVSQMNSLFAKVFIAKRTQTRLSHVCWLETETCFDLCHTAVLNCLILQNFESNFVMKAKCYFVQGMQVTWKK